MTPLQAGSVTPEQQVYATEKLKEAQAYLQVKKATQASAESPEVERKRKALLTRQCNPKTATAYGFAITHR